MAPSDDLRKCVVEAVVERGMSRTAAAKRFGVGIASALLRDDLPLFGRRT